MPEDASVLVLGTLGIAVIAVAVDPIWRLTRRLVTLVHEAGHATAMLVTFNWPGRLKVQPDGDGETAFPKGRKIFGPSAAFVYAVGYVSPSAVGLLFANGVDRRWSAAGILATLLVVLAAVLAFHEDWHTLAVVATAGALAALFFWQAGPVVQIGAVTALAWFLLLGGQRHLWQYGLSARRLRDIVDFGELAKLTGIPAAVWFFLSAFFALFALVQGARWLLA